MCFYYPLSYSTFFFCCSFYSPCDPLPSIPSASTAWIYSLPRRIHPPGASIYLSLCLSLSAPSSLVLSRSLQKHGRLNWFLLLCRRASTVDRYASLLYLSPGLLPPSICLTLSLSLSLYLTHSFSRLQFFSPLTSVVNIIIAPLSASLSPLISVFPPSISLFPSLSLCNAASLFPLPSFFSLCSLYCI